jgi:protein-tyrosine phosphatase
MDGVSAYRICFVCSGNICRSPTAEVVTRLLVAEAGLQDRVLVDSAGIGDWHVGDDLDRRSLAALRRRGYDVERHRARQFRPADFAARDLVVALDAGHERALRRMARSPQEAAKIRLLRSYDPVADGAGGPADLDVPDPYYGRVDEFEHVLDVVEAACRKLLAEVRPALAAR